MPLRDLLSFAVFLVSLFGETVHWRGTHFAGRAFRRDVPGLKGLKVPLRFRYLEV
jgi:hypothetical protein